MTRLRRLLILGSLLAIGGPFGLHAQQPTHSQGGSKDAEASGNRVLLVLPFRNDSKAPGLEWIGESFSEILGQRMQSASMFVISRQDRLYAFDRVGIPVTAQLSRATLLRIAEQMDVDYVVLGKYDYNGNSFTVTAQLLEMGRLHLSPKVTESGSLLQLIDIQAATAWDLMHEMQPALAATKQDFIAETRDIRLDALENYVRGTIASNSAEKIRRLKEAVRLNSNYAVATLQLGKTYFEQRDYGSAVAWLSKVPETDKHAAEANFFLGLSAYYSGNIDRAAGALRLVASRLPLTEVYNNLGVVEARRNKNTSIEYLQKATEADPMDADYHFNLAVSLARAGDRTAAIRELKEALVLRPSDAEARSYLETLSTGAASQGRVPLGRIKTNYDETSFRQLAFAIENAQEAQMANSNPKKHAAMHVDQGKQQLTQGFYEEALEHFRRALTLDSENTEAHLGLANAQIALNDLTGAHSVLNTILRSKPTPDAYLALAQLELKENKPDAANQDLDQALRLDPSNSAALRLRQQLALKVDAVSRSKQ